MKKIYFRVYFRRKKVLKIQDEKTDNRRSKTLEGMADGVDVIVQAYFI